MATKSKIGTDSAGRKWECGMDSDGCPFIKGIGHDTDPDSDALSSADEEMLLTLAESCNHEGFGSEIDDAVFLAYDRARDAREDEMMMA
jgi:hypothetical protein